MTAHFEFWDQLEQKILVFRSTKIFFFIWAKNRGGHFVVQSIHGIYRRFFSPDSFFKFYQCFLLVLNFILYHDNFTISNHSIFFWLFLNCLRNCFQLNIKPATIKLFRRRTTIRRRCSCVKKGWFKFDAIALFLSSLSRKEFRQKFLKWYFGNIISKQILVW